MGHTCVPAHDIKDEGGLNSKQDIYITPSGNAVEEKGRKRVKMRR